MDVKLKSFKRNNSKNFRLVQVFRIGEADFNHFMRLINQLVIAVETSGKEENLSPVLIPAMHKDMDEQLKLSHKVFDVGDRANRDLCKSAAV